MTEEVQNIDYEHAVRSEKGLKMEADAIKTMKIGAWIFVASQLAGGVFEAYGIWFLGSGISCALMLMGYASRNQAYFVDGLIRKDYNAYKMQTEMKTRQNNLRATNGKTSN